MRELMGQPGQQKWGNWWVNQVNSNEGTGGSTRSTEMRELVGQPGQQKWGNWWVNQVNRNEYGEVGRDEIVSLL